MKINLTNGILAIGLVVLYILHFNSTGKAEKEEVIIEETIDSTVTNSVAMIDLSDTTSLDSLKEADFSRIGFINMFKVVEQCPVLKNDLKKLEQQQLSLQRQEAQIYQDFDAYRSKKENELKRMQDKGLLDQMTYQMEMKEMAQKQAEAEQKVMDLKPKAENLQKSQMTITQKRNEIVQKALDEINEKLKLDYVLVQDGMNTSFFPLNEKNDISEQIILVVNKNNK